MGLAGMVALDAGVERGIVWFFSRIGGRGAVELQEEAIIRGLAGAFAAWKVCDGLLKLQERGVAVSVSRVQNRFIRRCWSIDPNSWDQIALFKPSRTWTDSAWQ